MGIKYKKGLSSIKYLMSIWKEAIRSFMYPSGENKSLFIQQTLMEQLWYTEYFFRSENSSEQNQVPVITGFYIPREKQIIHK